MGNGSKKLWWQQNIAISFEQPTVGKQVSVYQIFIVDF